MVQIEGRVDAQNHVDIGEPDIRVQNQCFLSPLHQQTGKIGGDVGFSHPSFAAGDGDDANVSAGSGRLLPGGGLLPELLIFSNFPKCCCLVCDHILPFAAPVVL